MDIVVLHQSVQQDDDGQVLLKTIIHVLMTCNYKTNAQDLGMFAASFPIMSLESVLDGRTLLPQHAES